MSAGEHRRAVTAALLAAALLTAGPAGAEPGAAAFDAAIAATRAAAGCPALVADPLAQRAAELSNRSTADYLDHRAEYVPVDDPLAVLHDLGSDAAAAVQLQGAADTAADAIEVALLQGYATLPDCGYQRLGTSVIEHPGGQTLVVAVLIGGPGPATAG
ncbi:hypothetical protein [Mycolicibacterium fallax]|jgi:hypothetical protein|uniref:CAP domain-containing protein n=2 Tax=Mycolicibacterium fallax TaxID=1793 RepID=A0A1X1QWI8_MYCFA|nr:hypothetical protein [Mycolicibacterium fallax]ORU95636.1 hypothetical protein AWC04_19895 [Mycolicibacterium fallax]HSA40098.1 hypothetical protein [Mycobacterium sp.]